MMRQIRQFAAAVPAACVLACALLCGCEGDWLSAWGLAAPKRAGGPDDEVLRIEPLAVQQARAYPETVTGLFASLADFENTPSGQKGHEQVGHFTIDPPAAGARRTFVVNVTRTGAGALEVVLPPKCELVFAIPYVHDFTGYRLLSMSLYSRSLRDDLRVTLETDGASWRSGRTLVRPGWNNVLIDIQRLADVEGFDITGVRALRLAFADAAGAVWFNLDDVMVIDNGRTIRPTPPGVVLRKSGLDYTLGLPGRSGEVRLAQGADGLWRMAEPRAAVALAAPGEELTGRDERLALMGDRRIGQVELLEHNAVRLRLVNTWYFPSRAGEWASLAVRRIRWEHVFYADGRWVTQVMLNNAGGRPIGSVGIFLSSPAAWSGGRVADRLVQRDFAGPVGRWQALTPPAGAAGKTVAANYLRPAALRRTVAARDVFAPGDAGRDGFDESEGCYCLAAKAGHCRFTVVPPPEGLRDPAFRVIGRWSGDVAVSSEGKAVRPVAAAGDGSVLFVLPGELRRPTAVEVAGKSAPSAGG